MSTFKYLVTVETERDSGLIASRDEQSEKIVQALEELDTYADITGIGARSDSDYSVASVDIWEMSKKDEKEMHAEYEREVREAAPAKDELLVELEAARADAAKYKNLYETQKGIVDQLLESPEFKETRIWTEKRNGLSDKVRTFLPDGRYDHVFFKVTDTDDDGALSIGIDDYSGDLEIRSNSMGREMFVIPQSGNEIRIRVSRRVR